MVTGPTDGVDRCKRAPTVGRTSSATGADGDRESGVLLTGATGFVGMELLARYLERSDRPVYALVRAEDEAAAAERMQETLLELFGDGAAMPEDRLVAVRGDLEAAGLGLSPEEREAL